METLEQLLSAMKLHTDFIMACLCLTMVVVISNKSQNDFQYNSNQNNIFGWSFNIKPSQGQSLTEIDITEDAKTLGYSGQRKIASDKNYLYVAYRKKIKGVYQIFVKKIVKESGGLKVEGDKPVTIVDGGINQRVPSITVVDSSVHVVWYGAENQENNRQIKYVSSDDGGNTWSKLKNIAQVDGYNGEDLWQEHPSIAADSKQNTLYVAWEGKDSKYKNQQIKITKSFDGGDSWSEWKNVKPNIELQKSRPYVLADNNGRVYIFAYGSKSASNPNQFIQYTFSDDKGENWSDWKIISDENSDARHISAAVDKNNDVHVVWRQRNISGEAMIIYRQYNGSIWTDSISISRSDKNQFFPSIGVANNGQPHVTWMESEDSSGFPYEDPQHANIFISTIRDGMSNNIRKIGISSNDMYPNVPEFSGNSSIPVLYEVKDANGLFRMVIEEIYN